MVGMCGAADDWPQPQGSLLKVTGTIDVIPRVHTTKRAKTKTIVARETDLKEVIYAATGSALRVIG
jgi:hypothetical protein